MEKTIWKYELQVIDHPQRIDIPLDSKIMTVQSQGESICMWVMVDPDAEKETRYFEVFGTGGPIHCDMGVSRQYIGTFQLLEGKFVGHLFERTE